MVGDTPTDPLGFAMGELKEMVRIGVQLITSLIWYTTKNFSDNTTLLPIYLWEFRPSSYLSHYPLFVYYVY